VSTTAPMRGPTETCALVIPCYNEAARFDGGPWIEYAEGHPEIRLVFVDDGSKDATRQILLGVREKLRGACRVLAWDENRGKAEAVRAGCLDALETWGPPGDLRFVGYWDADLATPLSAVRVLAEELEAFPDLIAAMGSRVRLLGRDIRRRRRRHIAGRIFATVASWGLAVPVYDTQCGAKLIRIDDSTRAIFADPFRSRWAFDVELLARLFTHYAARGADSASSVVHEVPLDAWRDIGPSKVGAWAGFRAFRELLRFAAAHRLKTAYHRRSMLRQEHPARRVSRPGPGG